MSTDTLSKSKEKTKKAPLYKVLLLNDDYTTWEFVCFVLMRFFNKTLDEANQITQDVHTKGVGLAGVYEFEIAETKAESVNSSARKEGHPFRAIVEPE